MDAQRTSGSARATGRLPSLEVPAGHLFGHPTRFVETFAPDVEHVLLKALSMPALDFSVVERGTVTASHWHHLHGRLRKRRWRLKNTLRIAQDARRRPIEVRDGLVYDGRWMANDNIAHILLVLAPRLLHASKLLAAAGQESRIRFVASEHLPAWARTAFELLGVEVVYTNGRVEGRVVEVACEDMLACLPQLYDVTFRGYTRDTPPRVFISRRGARTIQNEEEVWRFLAARGFERFYFEDEPVARQWSILRNAADVVAIHGAAMAALVFNRGGLSGASPTRLVELFTPGWMPSLFRAMAAAHGIRWAGVRGRVTPEMLRDLDFAQGRETRYEVAPFTVSVKSLEGALAHLGMG